LKQRNNGNDELAGRDSRGRFQPGCVPGPGSPLARQAVTIKKVWTEAAREEFTPAVAKEIIAGLLDIARNGERTRDRILAYDTPLARFGIRKTELEPETGSGRGGVTVVMSFTPDPPKPVDFIDQPPA
jgi:hypothetical protein